MGCNQSVPSVEIDSVAIGVRIAKSLADILKDTPKEAAKLKIKVEQEPEKKLVVQAREMLTAKEDVELTTENTEEMGKKIAVAALLISAQGKFDMCWICWTEITYDLAWKAFSSLNWFIRRAAMSGARKGNDAAVKKAIEAGLLPLIEKVRNGEVGGAGGEGEAAPAAPAAGEEKKEEEAAKAEPAAEQPAKEAAVPAESAPVAAAAEPVAAAEPEPSTPAPASEPVKVEEVAAVVEQKPTEAEQQAAIEANAGAVAPAPAE